jgi:hypothetical protein
MSIKEDAMAAISSLPDDATIEDMYCLHVLNKIQKGQEARKSGNVLTTDQFRLNTS